MNRPTLDVPDLIRRTALSRGPQAQGWAAAFDPARAVLARGNAHGWNMLQAAGQVPGSDPARFKLIDPDGHVAERAHDLVIPMREWSEELLAGDALVLGRWRCALLARLGGAAPEPIWQWALLWRAANDLPFALIER